MKIRPRIIALYSPAPQMGKSTAAQHLQRKYDYKPYKFAGRLKRMIEDLLWHDRVRWDEVDDHINGNKKDQIIPVFGKSAREMMQTLGTDWGRKMVHPDIWVHTTEQDIRQSMLSGHRIVIDDMRFPNEYEAMKSLGATMIYIVRSDAEIPPPSHASEGCLNGFAFDHTISVPLGIGYVHAAIDGIMKEYAE